MKLLRLTKCTCVKGINPTHGNIPEAQHQWTLCLRAPSKEIGMNSILLHAQKHTNPTRVSSHPCSCAQDLCETVLHLLIPSSPARAGVHSMATGGLVRGNNVPTRYALYPEARKLRTPEEDGGAHEGTGNGWDVECRKMTIPKDVRVPPPASPLSKSRHAGYRCTAVSLVL